MFANNSYTIVKEVLWLQNTQLLKVLARLSLTTQVFWILVWFFSEISPIELNHIFWKGFECF